MKLKGAQILCESLLREGVDTIFGFPGGAVLPLYDVLPQYPQLRHILVRHEQAAAHAADGYARATGRVGVCLATSGPGATNLVTGIATAYLDSSPVVALTGQVATPFIGKDSFQEVDITGITLPITKHNHLVMHVDEVAKTVKEAFHIAGTGRPGPVLIDLPRDVLVAETTFHYPEKAILRGYKPTVNGHPTQVKKAARLIDEAKRPLIIAGRGVLIAQAWDQLRELAEKAQIPVVTTLLGISSFPESHVLSFGMLGMHGMAYANMAVNEADLVIAVGMRFDDRATGRVSAFAPHAQVIHIDIDPAEIGKNIRVNVPIVGDLSNVLAALGREVEAQEHVEWIARIDEWRSTYPCTFVPDSDRMLPQYVIREIYEATGGQAIVVSDVGQNQMWTAQHYWFDRPNTHISSGGLGTMGFAFPAAIGAKIGRPAEPVWAIVGDGGFQMNIQELATLAQEQVPVKVAILNNGYLGMVRQWQELFYERRYVGTPLSGPDFAKVAEAYGVAGLNIRQKEDVKSAIRKAVDYDGPMILNFLVEQEENVYPMVAPGGSLGEVMLAPRKEVVAWGPKNTP